MNLALEARAVGGPVGLPLARSVVDLFSPGRTAAGLAHTCIQWELIPASHFPAQPAEHDHSYEQLVVVVGSKIVESIRELSLVCR